MDSESEPSILDDFDLDTPLDSNAGIQLLDGNEQMFLSMVVRLDQLTMDQSLSKAAEAMDHSKCEDLEEIFIGLKQAFKYIGAGRLYLVCH